MGGFDKHILARSQEECAEVHRLTPLVEKAATSASAITAPPDVPYANYLFYLRPCAAVGQGCRSETRGLDADAACLACLTA